MWSRGFFGICGYGVFFGERLTTVSSMNLLIHPTFHRTLTIGRPVKSAPQKKNKVSDRSKPQKQKQCQEERRKERNKRHYDLEKIRRKKEKDHDKLHRRISKSKVIDVCAVNPSNIISAESCQIEKMEGMSRWRVPISFSGARLDRFVAFVQPQLSFLSISTLLRRKRILLHSSSESAAPENGGILRPSFPGSHRLCSGDIVTLLSPSGQRVQQQKSEEEEVLKKKKKKCDRMTISKDTKEEALNWIIYSDPDFIVLNKPSGIAVQGRGIDIVSLLPVIGGGQQKTSSPPLQPISRKGQRKATSPQTQSTRTVNPQLHLVHRLDRETSGLLVLARHRLAAQNLSKQFAKHQIEKSYLAVVKGSPRPSSGRIILPLRKLSPMRVEVVFPPGNEQRSGATITRRKSENGGSAHENDGSDSDSESSMIETPKGKVKVAAPKTQKAITEYEVLHRSPQSTLSVVMFVPKTGRTHQLRVHSAFGLTSPILGDSIYGGREPIPPSLQNMIGKDAPLHLHAHQISFESMKGERIVLTAPLPKHMKVTFGVLGFVLPKPTRSQNQKN